MLAAQDGYTATVEALVQLGADVNAADKDGITARDWANDNGHTKIAERLYALQNSPLL